MTDIPNKRYFRPDEVATILEREFGDNAPTLRTIWYWLEKDKLKHLHVGGKTLVPRDEVERALERGV